MGPWPAAKNSCKEASTGHFRSAGARYTSTTTHQLNSLKMSFRGAPRGRGTGANFGAPGGRGGGGFGARGGRGGFGQRDNGPPDSVLGMQYTFHRHVQRSITHNLGQKWVLSSTHAKASSSARASTPRFRTSTLPSICRTRQPLAKSMRYSVPLIKSISPSSPPRVSKPPRSNPATSSTSAATSYCHWRSSCQSQSHRPEHQNPRELVVPEGELEEPQ